jgi:hypothetical protein
VTRCMIIYSKCAEKLRLRELATPLLGAAATVHGPGP